LTGPAKAGWLQTSAEPIRRSRDYLFDLGGREAAASVFVLFRAGELFGAVGLIFRFMALTALTLIWRAFPMGFMFFTDPAPRVWFGRTAG